MVDAWIWLVPAAAALVLAGLLLSRRFAGRVRRHSDHLVVFGAGNAALALLRAIPEPSRSVLVADRDRADVTDAARRLGARVVLGAPEELVRDVALERARWIALVLEDPERNLSLAEAVFGHLSASGSAARERTVLVEAASVDRRLSLESRADEGGWARFARILPFGLASLAARQTLADHPLAAVRAYPPRPSRIGLAGGSDVAEELLLALARRGWREPASRLRVVVADADGGTWLAELTARHPALRELLHLEEAIVIPADADTIPSDTAGPLFFGEAATGLRDALAREEQLERLGRAVHALYLDECERSGEKLGSRSSLRAWMELPEAMKEDNRRQVDGFEASLREIGWRTVPATGSSAQPFSDAEAEHLARREHERWMAARKLAGWRAGTPRDDAAHVHPDLVPFADLPEERRRLSRDAIRRIPLVFERLGRSVVADVVVAVPMDSTEAADPKHGAAAAGRAMEELRHAYPGRHVQLLSSIGTPFERGFCTAAMAEGATLAVVVVGPSAAQAAELDRHAAEAVAALHRGAECWIVPAEDRIGADPAGFFQAVATAHAHVHARAGR